MLAASRFRFAVQQRTTLTAEQLGLTTFAVQNANLLMKDQHSKVPAGLLQRQLEDTEATYRSLHEILPLASKHLFDNQRTISAAELIIKTAFAPGTISQRHNVELKKSAMKGYVASDVEALAGINPCIHTLTKRVHQLASYHFNQSQVWCSLDSKTCKAKDLATLNPALYRRIVLDFGSYHHMIQALRGFATERRSPGYTWLVWNPHASTEHLEGKVSKKERKGNKYLQAQGRLEVANTPKNVTPLTLSMFPLMAIDMTEEGVLTIPSDWAEEEAAQTPAAEIVHPSWSRAARNPEAAELRLQKFSKPTDRAFEGPAAQRQRRFDFSVQRIHWQYVSLQADRAAKWYADHLKSDRNNAIKGYVSRQIDMAKGKLLDELRNKRQSLDVSEDQVEKEIEAAAGSSAEGESAESATPETSASEGAAAEDVAASEATGEVTKPVTSEAEVVESTTTATSSTDASAEQAEAEIMEEKQVTAESTEEATEMLEYVFEKEMVHPSGVKGEPCDDGSVCYSFDDGSKHYYYSGDQRKKTIVHADGRQIFVEESVTTEVHPDGTMKYIYADATVMTIYPDGKKVTRWKTGEEQVELPSS